jgi:hypothetical protein
MENIQLNFSNLSRRQQDAKREAEDTFDIYFYNNVVKNGGRSNNYTKRISTAVDDTVNNYIQVRTYLSSDDEITANVFQSRFTREYKLLPLSINAFLGIVYRNEYMIAKQTRYQININGFLKDREDFTYPVVSVRFYDANEIEYDDDIPIGYQDITDDIVIYTSNGFNTTVIQSHYPVEFEQIGKRKYNSPIATNQKNANNGELIGNITNAPEDFSNDDLQIIIENDLDIPRNIIVAIVFDDFRVDDRLYLHYFEIKRDNSGEGLLSDISGPNKIYIGEGLSLELDDTNVFKKLDINSQFNFSTVVVEGEAIFNSSVMIEGDLTVNGEITYINATSLNVADNIIELNYENTQDTTDSGFLSKYDGDYYAGLIRKAGGEFQLLKDIDDPGLEVDGDLADLRLNNINVEGTAVVETLSATNVNVENSLTVAGINVDTIKPLDETIFIDGDLFVNGTISGNTGELIPPGTIVMYAGGGVPEGWLLCDGANVSRSLFARLFETVSTTFGVGNNSTTFTLPDFRSRVPIGVGASLGLTERALGEYGGGESVIINSTNLP